MTKSIVKKNEPKRILIYGGNDEEVGNSQINLDAKKIIADNPNSYVVILTLSQESDESMYINIGYELKKIFSTHFNIASELYILCEDKLSQFDLLSQLEFTTLNHKKLAGNSYTIYHLHGYNPTSNVNNPVTPQAESFVWRNFLEGQDRRQENNCVIL